MRLAVIELGSGATLQSLHDALRDAGSADDIPAEALALPERVRQELARLDCDQVLLQPVTIQGLGAAREAVDRVLANWPIRVQSSSSAGPILATADLAELLDVLGPSLAAADYSWQVVGRGSDPDATVHIQLGETTASGAEALLILETNIDDMNPQFFEVLCERLFAAGALDVWTTAIVMKKQRPATMLSLLARPGDRDELISLLVEQSTTLGVRISPVDRIAADRRFESVITRAGEVQIKLKIWKGRVLDAVPEYDDCAALARQYDLPVREIWVEAAMMGQVFIGRQVEGRAHRLTTLDRGGVPRSGD